jgi:hypothetical protein
VAGVSRRHTLAPFSASLALLLACGGGSHASAQHAYADQVAAAIPGIEHGAGLRFKKPPVVQERSKEEVRQFLEHSLTEKMSAREIDGTQSAYRLLGLIPDTLDLRKLLLDFYTEQIAGYYDPQTKVLYVVKGTSPEMVGVTIDHELVHALQDQYTNLDSLLNIKGDADRSLAASAVFEGQATVLGLQAALGPRADLAALLGWEQLRDQIKQNAKAMPVLASAPAFIQETAIFPYVGGADFYHRFTQQRHGQEPYGSNMPSSTEQILHDSAYFKTPRDEPVRITLPAPVTGTDFYQDDLGEFQIRVLLANSLRDPSPAMRAAAGWDGDRFMVVRTPSGDGIVWVSVWDTPLDAAEFADAMRDVASQRWDVKVPAAVKGKTTLTMHGRSITIDGADIGGRAAVIYTDVPAGIRGDVVRATAVRISS